MTKVITELVEAKSDLTGKAASETRKFALGGVSYSLDLTEQEAGVFDRTIGKYTAKASVVSVNPNTLREWARSNGFEVGERGRLSAELREAFEAAKDGSPEKIAAETVDA